MDNAPRHTARQIADDVAAGMDPDVEGVPAQYYDAAMQRIAELEEERDAAVEFAHSAEQAFCAANTELARVKAESLRVVPVGPLVELVTLYGHQKFLFDDYGVCEMRNPGRYDSTVDVRVLATGEVMNCETYAVFVQPVRLERWEDDTHANNN